MMKTTMLLPLCLLLAFPSFGQENMPVLLVDRIGKTCYRPPEGGKAGMVAPGAALKRSGTLSLKSRAGATLLYNGKFKKVAGKNTYALSDLFKETQPQNILGFESVFAEYVLSAFQMAARAADAPSEPWAGVKSGKNTGDGWGGGGIVDPPKTGDGWGAGIVDPPKTGDGWGREGIVDPPKTGDGWGGRGQAITAILPFGKIAPGNTVFFWSRPAGRTTFTVQVTDEAGKVVLSHTTRDTFWAVNLVSPGISQGRRYNWQVTTPEKLASNTMGFEVAPETERAAALKKAENTDLYKNGTEVLRGLLRAVALEDREWYADAAQTYGTVQQNHRGHQTARLMHAAFWVRRTLKEKAVSVYGRK
jgi:hypothetical protein